MAKISRPTLRQVRDYARTVFPLAMDIRVMSRGRRAYVRKEQKWVPIGWITHIGVEAVVGFDKYFMPEMKVQWVDNFLVPDSAL